MTCKDSHSPVCFQALRAPPHTHVKRQPPPAPCRAAPPSPKPTTAGHVITRRHLFLARQLQRTTRSTRSASSRKLSPEGAPRTGHHSPVARLLVLVLERPAVSPPCKNHAFTSTGSSSSSCCSQNTHHTKRHQRTCVVVHQGHQTSRRPTDTRNTDDHNHGRCSPQTNT